MCTTLDKPKVKISVIIDQESYDIHPGVRFSFLSLLCIDVT